MPDADVPSDQSHRSPGRGSSGEPIDRASAAGLPPDSGPEKEVVRVRPSLWRGHPIAATLLLLLPVGVLVVALLLSGATAMTSVLIGAGVAGVCWLVLFVWWLNFSVARSLWISNKRTVERRGLLSRSINEVLHDHVRNIQVKQSFIQRVFRIGSVGISSAGQDGIEIFMKDLPRPDDIKRTIDLYRPL